MSDLVRASVAALAAYTPGEQPADRSLVKLNTNENPYPPSPAVAEALRAFAAEDLRLYPDPACRALREALAALHGCRPEQVFVGNGSDEVLALCTRAFVEREGAIGFFEPSYSLYPVLAAIRDVPARPVRLGPDFGWRMPEDPRTSLFFLANPNAPTGRLFPEPEVAAFCRLRRGVVVLDEAYADFACAHGLHLALGLDNVLVTRTLSKAYALAGLRLGYAVGAEPLVAALEKIKDSYNVDRLTQRLALAAVGDQAHLRETVARIRRTRDRVAAELARRGLETTPSETNFLWTRAPDRPAAELFGRLRAEGILVRYFPGELTGGHLRVTIGTDAQMDAFLAALDRIRGGGGTAERTRNTEAGQAT